MSGLVFIYRKWGFSVHRLVGVCVVMITEPQQVHVFPNSRHVAGVVQLVRTS